jgi:hypothetical protein
MENELPPDHIPVESSNIASFAHRENKLQVLFKSGVLWEYEGVTLETYIALCEAESKGSFFSKNIFLKEHQDKSRNNQEIIGKMAARGGGKWRKGNASQGKEELSLGFPPRRP